MEPQTDSRYFTYSHLVSPQHLAQRSGGHDSNPPQPINRGTLTAEYPSDPQPFTFVASQFSDPGYITGSTSHAFSDGVESGTLSAYQASGLPDGAYRRLKRNPLACQFCRKRRAKCDGGRPCENCAASNERCEYSQLQPQKPDLEAVVKDGFQALSGQIEMLAMTIGPANVSPKRKRTDSIDTELAVGESLATRTLPSKTIKRPPPEAEWDVQRCLIKHSLSQKPTSWSGGESVHYFIHSFIPGRSFTRNHSFSDLLRYQHIATSKMLLPALMTLYMEQVKIKFVETEHRRQLDKRICDTLIGLWKLNPLVDPIGVLYFTLLAIQYIIIRPRLTDSWCHFIVPSLRSELCQKTLLRHGNLGLRLKINSHWIFSDTAHALYPKQPTSFLQYKERTINIIDPLVGLSPQLLDIYASATLETSEQRPSRDSNLWQTLEGITQCVPCNDDSSAEENVILERCASAYLEGAYIYLLCRLQRRPASDPQVHHHRGRLRQLLNPDLLPLSGSLFRAVWPLLPAFILCVTSYEREERHTLREGIIQELHQSGSYSNIPPALDAISRIWFDEKLDMRIEGWWEDMVALIGGKRISLT